MSPPLVNSRASAQYLPSIPYLVRKIKTHRHLALVSLLLVLVALYKLNLFFSNPSVQPKSHSTPEIANHRPLWKNIDAFSNDPYIPSKPFPEKGFEKLLTFAKSPLASYKQTQSDSDIHDCPHYSQYSSISHTPLSKGPLRLPFQRPSNHCRKFSSPSVEQVINELNDLFIDPDLARLFENCFPNTLDTTILWHNNGSDPQTCIVTGDINALWLRDSHKQAQIYFPLARSDPKIKTLLLGLINTQASFVLSNPYCNAFHPPSQSGIQFKLNNENDAVYPRPDLDIVFECKYEIDSLASFLAISNLYYKHTNDSSFVTSSWMKALSRVWRVLQEQATPTFSPDGRNLPSYYAFRRNTDTGTDTLNLNGIGNPANSGTFLIKSSFRPSDDAAIYPFFIPGNAFVSVELKRTAQLLDDLSLPDLANQFKTLGNKIQESIYANGTHQHPVFGKVFAYEVDGYGSVSIMDDANTPSLLSLPDMGFLSSTNPIYLNTRRMILSDKGNPYYLSGAVFQGIGGPHIGTRFAWPMSHIIAIRTTNNDTEILYYLDLLKNSTAGLGLMHESVNVDLPYSYTRSWFAWCNSEFAKTILHLAQHKPYLVFGQGASPYVIGNGADQSQENGNGQ